MNNIGIAAKAAILAMVLSSFGCATQNKHMESTPGVIPVQPLPAVATVACVSCDLKTVGMADEPESISFADWLAGFRVRLRSSGATADTIAAMLDGLEPDSRIIERDRNQPEFVRPIWSYLDSAASTLRIANGQKAYAARRESIDAIAQHYGVRPEILLAIWGLESSYGVSAGNKDVIRSLATLAWEGRRRDWAESQLIAAAQMIDRGFATRDQLTGSWAGAMGQTQFIPTTYLENAVDWDGDGRRNIWTDEYDALASTANLLQRAGWQHGAPVVQEVLIPATFDLSKWEPEHNLLVSVWEKHGFRQVGDAPWTAEDMARSAKLEMPAGRSGPAFLTYPNFDVIKRYNNSTAYALGVAYLAERIAGGNAFAGAWPKDDMPLTRSQIKELQSALNAQGFNAGKPDGMTGPKTHRALRDFQRANALDADGYIGTSAFARVMAAKVR